MFDEAQALIIDRYKNPVHAGEMSDPDAVVRGENPLCGDEIEIALKLRDGVITDIKHRCRACAVCAASTDLLAERLKGREVQEIQATTPETVQKLLGIPLSPTRLKCALLPLETLKQAEI
ncbi:iron-sulfur cluster assembly scaffold protein [Patescibacteria group bacterium]|nr:iron-sulfur cluster assembly scaffold protein [Patescibacteria group bacterium]